MFVYSPIKGAQGAYTLKMFLMYINMKEYFLSRIPVGLIVFCYTP